MQIRRVTLFPELMVVLRADTTHGFNHLLAELHGRGHGLGVAAQNVAEVNVEQLAVGGQQ